MEQWTDEQAKAMALKFGYRQVPWNGVVFVAIFIQMVLAMLAQYARKDFLVITACCCAWYHMEFPESARRRSFRTLVGIFVLSLAYDVARFMLINSDDSEDEETGGLERNVRKFSTFVAYISFVFRVSRMPMDNNCCLDHLGTRAAQSLAGLSTYRQGQRDSRQEPTESRRAGGPN